MELDEFLKINILDSLELKFQHSNENELVNSYFIPYSARRRNITLLDDRAYYKDSDIYYSAAKSPIDESYFYQISFNWELVDKDRLLAVLKELFNEKLVSLKNINQYAKSLYPK